MSSRFLTKFLHSSSLVHSTLRFPIIFLPKIRLSENSEKDARFLLYEEEAASMPNPPSEIVLLQRKRDHMTPRNNSPSLHPGFAFIQPDTTKQYDHQVPVRKISSAESDLTLERMDFGGRSSTSSSDNNNNARFDPKTFPTQRSKASDEDWLELGLSSKSQPDLDIKSQKNPRIASPQQPTMRNEESYYYSKNTPVLPPPPSIPQFPPAVSNHWSYRENRANKSSIDPGGSRSSLPGDIQALSSMFTSFASQGRPVKNWADFRSGGETSNSFGVYEGFGSQHTENRHIFRPDIPPPPAPQQNNNNSVFPSFLTEMRSTFPPLDTWRSNKDEALTSSWFRGNAADPAHILPTTTALKYDGGLEGCSVDKRKKNSNIDSNITGWTEHTRIFKPSRRSQTGVWFTLQGVNDNNSRDRGLPQIPRNYLRIKDGNTTILTVKKYLVNKLGLHHESEVELSCKGQFLSPSLTLQHVHDVLWSSSFKDANIPIKFTNFSDNVNNSFDLMSHVMILNYHRGLTSNQ